MKKGIIIAGGEVFDKISDFITQDTIVVCADSGYLSALKEGINPNCVIGDFDSMDIQPHEINFPVQLHKIEKDETDTQLCIDYLCKLGVQEILLFGALGGARFDHSYANLQLLAYSLKKGVRLVIKDKTTEIFMISSEKICLKGKIGDIVSVFAINKAEGVSYKGLKYNLENGEIRSDLPFACSNMMIDKVAEISVKNGELLIIHIGGENYEKR